MVSQNYTMYHIRGQNTRYTSNKCSPCLPGILTVKFTLNLAQLMTSLDFHPKYTNSVLCIKLRPKVFRSLTRLEQAITSVDHGAAKLLCLIIIPSEQVYIKHWFWLSLEVYIQSLWYRVSEKHQVCIGTRAVHC